MRRLIIPVASTIRSMTAAARTSSLALPCQRNYFTCGRNNNMMTTGACMFSLNASAKYNIQEQRRFASSDSSSEEAEKKTTSSGGKNKFGMLCGALVFPLAFFLVDRYVFPLAFGTDSGGENGEVDPDLVVGELVLVPKPSLGGPFELMDDTTKKIVTDKDVFTGKWTLLYFGFSKCAVVCPSTMDFVQEVFKNCDEKFGGKKATAEEKDNLAKLQCCFVSIDYLRDTPEVLRNFLNKYNNHKRIVGLCGEKPQVEKIAKEWRVYFTSVEETDEERAAREEKGYELPSDTYQFDHSAAIYFVGPDGKLKDFYFKEMGLDNAVERIGLHFSNAYGYNEV